MSTQTRVCGNCGQRNQIVHTGQRCAGCNQVAFSMTDSDEGVSKHMIPSHFFENGPYEVWARRGYDGGMKLERITSGVSLETAKAYSWPYKEIRLNGVAVAA